MTTKILVQIHWDDSATRWARAIPAGSNEAEELRAMIRVHAQAFAEQCTLGQVPTVTAIVEP